MLSMSNYPCTSQAQALAEINDTNRSLKHHASTRTIHWDDNDPEHPYNMNFKTKWLAVITVSLGSLCVTCTSSIYTTTYSQTMSEFHHSQEIATLGLSLFIWGMGVGPLLLSPLSETLLIGRFLSGFSGSAFLSVAGGTVGDIFPRHELAFPMMIYTASPFVGPEIGPLLGGFINQYTDWRWTFYVLLIWAAMMLGLVYLFVPETYQPVLLSRKAQQIRKQTGNPDILAPNEKHTLPLRTMISQSISRPIMLLALEPMCLSLCIYSAILLGIIYLFFGAFQTVFESVYGFQLWQRGLSFLGLLVGMIFAILSDPYWKWRYRRSEKNHAALGNTGSHSMPEWRLPPAILGAPLVTVGLFIFAWTTYPTVHWIVPIIGSGIFGAGTILAFSGIFTFLVDAYPTYSASALAANSFTRSTFAGIFPLFGTQSKKVLTRALHDDL
ncbi:hypothetical protein PENSTE_c022G01609 [Penicillium steckii]|uniref:Major facilitator superfamily (MFS) profile domain-containing protein n=1 Tax=Penicillium steckii TaxID=303698 RepID=A0A1V6SSG4_9EURO|nr:hypothetical protein PENSTE_c022G01609 [Penicillium steckii]